MWATSAVPWGEVCATICVELVGWREHCSHFWNGAVCCENSLQNKSKEWILEEISGEKMILWKLPHAIMEAEKSNNMLSKSWRTREAGSGIQCESKNPNAGVGYRTWRPDSVESQGLKSRRGVSSSRRKQFTLLLPSWSQQVEWCPLTTAGKCSLSLMLQC